MSTTHDDGSERPRDPGWYPDPRDPSRRRHWDGSRWSELSAGEAFGPPMRGRATAVGRRSDRRAKAVMAAAAVLALVAVGAWLTLGTDRSEDAGEGGGTTTGPATTEGPEQPSDDELPATPGPLVEDPAGAAGNGAVTSPPAPDDVVLADCSVDADELLARLREHPPLEPFAAGLVVGETRCVEDWSTAVVSAPDTDSALAVFVRGPSGWTLRLVGSSDPCTGLGIPVDAEGRLGCGGW